LPSVDSAWSSLDDRAVLELDFVPLFIRDIQLTVFLFGRLIMRLLLLDRGVVVDEDECAFIFGVGVALCALVARTEITLPHPSTSYSASHGVIIFNARIHRSRAVRSSLPILVLPAMVSWYGAG
jgi:hypothetical protein